LFKNVLRSLKKNKASVIGLTFLVFLSMGLFTVLDSTAKNISNEYNIVSTRGNIHDFTISEKYNTGNVKFAFGPVGAEPQLMGKSSDGKDIPWPIQSGSFERTYQVCLDVSGQEGSELYSYYQAHGVDPTDTHYKTLNPTYEGIKGSTQLDYLSDTSAPYVTNKTYAECTAEIEKSGDLPQLASRETTDTITILDLVATDDTPIQQYLNTPEMKKVTS
jgi:hypothetical protein